MTNPAQQIFAPPRHISIDEPLYEALLDGVTLEARFMLLEEVAEGMGWRWRIWPAWAPRWMARFSMTITPLRLILISRQDDVELARARVNQLCSLAHELAHARRAETLGPLTWLVSYFISPSFRRAEEIEGDAWGTAMRAAMRGLSQPYIRAPLRDDARAQAAAWSGWSAPYFCGGDVEDGAEAVLERAGEILARAEVGRVV